MPVIADIPPKFIQDELNSLNKELDLRIPVRTAENLLIATWNIRSFGRLTEKWKADPGDSPTRDLQSLRCIIEIIKRFDIIALQEVRNDIKCLRDTLKVLGADWSFIMTDVTRGNPGNSERLAFLFNNTRVKLSGLACELVVPKEQLENDLSPDALRKQFARTPYAVGFKVGSNTFILLTLHVLYGEKEEDRVPEIKAISDWMYDWAKQLKRWGQSLVILGDFNIERRNSSTWKAFKNNDKLFIPPEIEQPPKTIFREIKFYDQIGWYKNCRSIPQLNIKYKTGGIFDFRDHVLRSRNYDMRSLSFRISDHFPLWAEFGR